MSKWNKKGSSLRKAIKIKINASAQLRFKTLNCRLNWLTKTEEKLEDVKMN